MTKLRHYRTYNDGHSERADPDASLADETASYRHTPGRREVLSHGAKLAFVVPVVMTFCAKDAVAAGSNYSCYPAGHACPGAEPCCDNLACRDGVCADPCVEAGGLCFGDSDCCSGDCQLGICQ
ncbi:MAG: hypothetical protein JSU86_09125 [Phycisphaerales bacterium]|nr:MAG: hypothetical protein JSU86_09125 [Phycisphaerales bacterium]